MPVNYDEDLSHLFQSTDTKRPYKVDNNVIQLTNQATFKSDINIGGFLKNVTAITVNQQNTSDVESYIGKIVNDALPSLIPPAATSTMFKDNAHENDIFINVTRGNNINESVLKNIIEEIVRSNIVDNIAKNHSAFRDFLYDIIEDISKNIFMQAGSVLFTYISSLNETDSRYIYLGDASAQFSNLRSGRNSTLLSLLKKACIAAMKEVFQHSIMTITVTDMKDMGLGSSKFQGRFYYDLRARMLTKLDVSTIYNDVNDNQIIYFKKVVIDLFLKSAFPCVHMLYLQTLISYYGEKGDFVNVRIMMLASVYYVFYTLKELVAISDTLPATSLGKITIQQAASLNNILTIINEYLTNNNKIRVDSESDPKEGMKKLIVELHELSKDVTDTNSLIQSIKRSIVTQQLAMRNVLFNLEVIRSRYWWASFEFWAILTIIILFIIGMSVMLVLAEMLKKPQLIDWVQYICGFVALSVILIKIVMLIIYFMKGTNK